MIIEVLKGLLLGTSISALNHFLTLRVLGDWGKVSSHKAKGRVTGVLFLRYFLNFATLFLVYKNVPMLVGAAFGLTMVKNILFFKYLIKRKG
jgi:hypothetical protein